MDFMEVLHDGRGGDLDTAPPALKTAAMDGTSGRWEDAATARRTVAHHFPYLALCDTFLPVIACKTDWTASQQTRIGSYHILNWSTRTGVSTVSNEAFMAATLKMEWAAWTKMYAEYGQSMKQPDRGRDGDTTTTGESSSGRSKGGTFKGYWETEELREYYNKVLGDVATDRKVDGVAHDVLYSNYKKATWGEERSKKRNREPSVPVVSKVRTIVDWGDSVSNRVEV